MVSVSNGSIKNRSLKENRKDVTLTKQIIDGFGIGFNSFFTLYQSYMSPSQEYQGLFLIFIKSLEII